MEPGELLEAATAEAWRSWLSTNHERYRETWVVFYRKAAGRAWLSYEESIEEALCYGWVDGQGKRLDDMRHAIRFTPRRPGRPWAESNQKRALRLMDQGRMTPAGAAVFPPDLAARWQELSGGGE